MTNRLLVILAIGVLSGCVGAKTFHEYARAGDTVAMAVGWKRNFSRDNITVTITPAGGTPIVYQPNNPAIRAVVNLYPDPVSSVVVSTEIGQDLTAFARTYGFLVNGYTNGDKDWWETTVFIDLPPILPTGTASINISDPTGGSVNSIIEIIPGAGSPNTFQTTYGPLNAHQIASLERVPHYTVNFSGATIPYAIQIDLVHDPDVDHGGTGRPYVVNPRGDLKNVTWSDTGTGLRVIIIPTKARVLSNIHDYKFYVAGGLANLTVLSVKAVDINGNNMSGVTAILE